MRMQLSPALRRAAVTLVAGVGLVLGFGAPALAHHSFTMFDPAHPLTLDGVVKSWEFANPHSWLVMLVRKGDGWVEYSIEGSSVNTLIRQGFGPHSFQPGDRITMVISPLKDGAAGGAFVKATKADGTVLTQSPTPN
ncbi:MAG TPA: DUF6152 family protein [Steroidobacteraceae bacterium]|nr:DUF6152 family protein [Steroidobacteraceae bacterium]